MISVAKKTFFIRTSLLSFIVILAITLPEVRAQVSTESILLVDFGATEVEDQYGIDGWKTPIVGPHTDYTAVGPGGTTQISGEDKFDSYQGVRGTQREFTYGERIIVTWYNNGSTAITVKPLISFTDPDNPVDAEGEPQWYPMTNVSIKPQETAQTSYDIVDGSQYHSYPVSAGTYALVNVCPNTAEKNQLVVDKIELRNEVDNIAPQAPQNLRVVEVSDTWVNLEWDEAQDNEGISMYFIYRDGQLAGASAITGTFASYFTYRDTNFGDYYLAPQTGYTYTVTALDTNNNESVPSPAVTVTTEAFEQPDSIHPWQDIEYVGAFKLPDTPGGTWSNSHTLTCSALTYYPYPNGNYPEAQDPGGMDDGYPGSLFAVGNWGTSYGAGRVAEIGIPQPVKTKNVDELHTAKTLQPFADVRAFDYSVQLPTIGLEYVPAQGTQQSDKLYHLYGEYYVMSNQQTDTKLVTHGASELDLSNPQSKGGWRIGPKGGAPQYDEYVFLDLFSIPKEWADAHTGGRMLITGRASRTGARVGDSLYAIGPWVDSSPAPLPDDQSHNDDYLNYVMLLHYDKIGQKARNEFHITDSFLGGSWITTGTQSAVILSGKKALGDFWYGFPDGSPPGLLSSHVPSLYSYDVQGDKGHIASSQRPLILFYDPSDLAKVAQGQLEPWKPQPYAGLDVSEYMFKGEEANLGAVSFDSQNGFLYAVEAKADEYYPVVHVFKLRKVRLQSCQYADFP